MALRPAIVGMALAEPGRFDDSAGEPDPSLLHISMVFVHPAAQRSGVGLPLVLHVLDVAGSHGYQRVAVWTAKNNTPARRLYERAGMTLTGKSAPARRALRADPQPPRQHRGLLRRAGAQMTSAWGEKDERKTFELTMPAHHLMELLQRLHAEADSPDLNHPVLTGTLLDEPRDATSPGDAVTQPPTSAHSRWTIKRATKWPPSLNP